MDKSVHAKIYPALEVHPSISSNQVHEKDKLSEGYPFLRYKRDVYQEYTRGESFYLRSAKLFSLFSSTE